MALFWYIIKENKKYLFLASMILITSIFLGYIVNPYNELIISSFEKLNELAREIIEKESISYSILTIFLNNFKVALYMIVLGVFFGIYPILMLAFNGIFIGLFIRLLVEDGQSVLLLFLGLIPHGIFELTAIILAAAYGIKIGLLVFETLINFIKRKKLNNLYIKYSDLVKQILLVITGVALLLLIAAIIESTLSLYLIKNFL